MWAGFRFWDMDVVLALGGLALGPLVDGDLEVRGGLEVRAVEVPDRYSYLSHSCRYSSCKWL